MGKKHSISKWAVLQFLVLCIGDGTIYMPAYCRSNFYDAFIDGFQVNNTQFGSMFLWFTFGMLATYFIGGILADKVSPRYLLTISFGVTAVLTLWMSAFPSYRWACLMYFLMGLSTTFTFWAPLIKATRQFGKHVGGESKALGFLEGSRAIWAAISGSIISGVFVYFAGTVFGLRVVLYIYAGILFCCAVGAFCLFTDDTGEVTYEGNPFRLVKECLKNPAIWILSLAVMGTYAVTSTMTGYTSKLASVCFGMPVAAATFMAMVPSYLNPIGSFLGGFMGDKRGATRTFIIGTAALVVISFVITILPNNAGATIPFIIIFSVMVIFNGVVRGQFYAPLREANIPMYLSGTATGLIATIGYSPDMFMSVITGHFLDTMDQVQAFKYVIYLLCGFGIFAIIMAFLLLQWVKKHPQQTQKTVDVKG